jgi:peptidyl-dipeptidase A
MLQPEAGADSSPMGSSTLGALLGDDPSPASNASVAADVSKQDAEIFVTEAERRLHVASQRLTRAEWIATTYMIADTAALLEEEQAHFCALSMDIAREALRYHAAALELDYDTRRKLELLGRTVGSPTPIDPERNAEMQAVSTRMESQFGHARVRTQGDGELTVEEVGAGMRDSRDPEALRRLWTGWYDAAPPVPIDYARYVELANEGARALGHADAGAEWRAGRDMHPDAFMEEIERLWMQLAPFYDALHTYVRRRLVERYGLEEVGADSSIPLHLLGNLWGQDWSGIEDIVLPPDMPDAKASDLDARLRARGITAEEMVRIAEGFYTSLGFDPLPKVFWERSMFVRPRDRHAQTHATAFDMYDGEDFRIRMGIRGTAEDFYVLHHELGHNFYQRAYAGQPFLYRRGANADFHEGVADTIGLSITPTYLARIGLAEDARPCDSDIPFLLRRALSSIAFLPFGYMVDRWRWEVFAGKIAPADYTRAWWAYAECYQRVRPPVDRSEAPFDPGAKYHIAADVAYMPYFVARVLQYQFHRSLCAAAGERGPLHRASIYGSRAAGEKLRTMLELGRSRPWQDALELLCGTRAMDATAITDYFAPLRMWLDEQNARA